MPTFTRAGLQGRLYWLLDLRIAGQVLRLSTSHISAIVDGETHEYVPGLEWQRSSSQALTPYSSAPPSSSVDVTLHLDATGLSVLDLADDGAAIGSATACLRLYSAVDERSEILIDGVLRDPSWGGEGDPIVATIEEDPLQDLGAIVPLSRRLGPGGDPDTNRVGEYLPLIIGSPSGYGTSHDAGSPGLLYDISGARLIIAGTPTVAGYNGDDVLVTNTSQKVSEYLEAEHVLVGEILCTVVELTGTLASPAAGDTFYVGWHNFGGDQTYGLARPDGSPLRGAGDLLMYLARRSRFPGRGWDLHRLDAIRAELNAYSVDCYIMPEPDEVLSPMEWAERQLLAMLPVSAHLGAHGLYFRSWRFAGDRSQAVAHIRAIEPITGRGNAARVSAVRTTALDDVRTAIQVHYSRNAKNGRYRYDLIIAGQPEGMTTNDGDDAVIDPSLRQAHMRYGDRGLETYSLDIVETEATARLVAAAMAKRHGPQRMSVVYDVEQYPGGMVEPGDVVLVTDDRLGWSERVGIATETEWTDAATVEITVEIPSSGGAAA